VSQIAAFTRDKKLAELLDATGLTVRTVDPEALEELARSDDAPPVVIVDLRGHDHLPAELITLRRRHTDIGSAIVVSSLDPKLIIEAMRAGCNECVAEPLSAPALDEAVRKLLVHAAPEAPRQVLAFVGAKGGVGTTTLAVNAAAALRAGKLSSVLLVDAQIGTGEAALFFGAEPRFSILDALENVHRVDESFFSSLVEKARGGVHLLAASSQAIHRQIDDKRVRALIDAATHAYQATVLDVPRTDPVMLDSLDAASRIVVVTSQEIASLRNAARLTETLRGRYGDSRVAVVVNRFSDDAVIDLAAIERVVGGKVEYRVPGDYPAALEALNEGRPIVTTSGPLAKALKGMTRKLTGLEADAPARPGSMFGRLAWRRA
jgi:pilus assembly protein CpaE